jgi:hypothetical protein
MGDQIQMLGGKKFLLGLRLLAIHETTHRDPLIYSTDADVWRPERWLENDGRSAMALEDTSLLWIWKSDLLG